MKVDTFAVTFSIAAVIVSVVMGFITEYWVGMLVYAICVLELLVILILTSDAWWWR